jgi:hypothetical protein
VSEKCVCLRNPGTYLVSLKTHEIGIVALLASLKKVVVEASQIPGDDTGSHVIPIEEAAYPSVPG